MIREIHARFTGVVCLSIQSYCSWIATKGQNVQRRSWSRSGPQKTYTSWIFNKAHTACCCNCTPCHITQKQHKPQNCAPIKKLHFYPFFPSSFWKCLAGISPRQHRCHCHQNVLRYPRTAGQRRFRWAVDFVSWVVYMSMGKGVGSVVGLQSLEACWWWRLALGKIMHFQESHVRSEEHQSDKRNSQSLPTEKDLKSNAW